jgi:hypothetical protein
MHTEALTKEGLRLFPALPAFGSFYLAGGTALALQIGHRVSVDFDLFSQGAIEGALLAKAERIFALEPVAPLVDNADQLTFLTQSVKITFLHYPFPLLEALVSLDGLSALSVREIAATKAYTIGRRGTYKDYIDLYFILMEGKATLAEVINMAERKFGTGFNSRLFAEQLLFLEDVRDYQIDFLKARVTPDELTAFFRNQIEELPLR